MGPCAVAGWGRVRLRVAAVFGAAVFGAATSDRVSVTVCQWGDGSSLPVHHYQADLLDYRARPLAKAAGMCRIVALEWRGGWGPGFSLRSR